jgi:hypothetical protein
MLQLLEQASKDALVVPRQVAPVILVEVDDDRRHE